jgi:hypothetical protein
MNEIFIQKLLTLVKQDPRIVGLIDYGSASEGRGDKFSDVDVALFIRDADFDVFNEQWKEWASQLGTLRLAYVGGVGHPWAVYADQPIPLRVDFAFHRDSSIETIIPTWPNSPVSVEKMVLYDPTGRIAIQVAQHLVGQSLALADVEQTFESVSGDFWYYLLRLYGKLQRDQLWAMRFEYNFIVIGNLLALLRLEAGATERWRASSTATGIETVISEQRLRQLNQCIPAEDRAGLVQATLAAITLGKEVCCAIAADHGWNWPHVLADEIETLFINCMERESADA